MIAPPPSTSVATAGGVAPLSATRSRWRQVRLQWHVLTRNTLQKAAVAFIALLVLVAVIGPYVVPHPESIRGAVNQSEVLHGPSWSHPFGTDEYGADIFSRVVYGARISLSAGLLTIGLAVAIGSTLGVIAAGLRGVVDDIIMRACDIFLSFPTVVLAIVIAAYWGGNLRNAVLALALSWWPYYARLVRGVAVSVRERPYVQAARSIGTPTRTIIFRHILPSSLGPTIVSATLDLGGVILALAALSFLGVGAQPPTPEWGLMVNQSRAYFLNAWWYMAFPGLAITLTVLAFNILGDGLGEVLNPKTRGRG